MITRLKSFPKRFKGLKNTPLRDPNCFARRYSWVPAGDKKIDARPSRLKVTLTLSDSANTSATALPSPANHAMPFEPDNGLCFSPGGLHCFRVHWLYSMHTQHACLYPIIGQMFCDSESSFQEATGRDRSKVATIAYRDRALPRVNATPHGHYLPAGIVVTHGITDLR